MNYKQVDDLAVVWCEYGEMELRHENYEQALRILRVRPIFFHCIYTVVLESTHFFCDVMGTIFAEFFLNCNKKMGSDIFVFLKI